MYLVPPSSFESVMAPLQLLPLPGENFLEVAVVLTIFIIAFPIVVGFLLGLLQSLPTILIGLVAVVKLVWDGIVGAITNSNENDVPPPPTDALDRPDRRTEADSRGATPPNRENPTVMYDRNDVEADSESQAAEDRENPTVVYTDDN